MQAMNDDAVLINRSINFIIEYFINRLIVVALAREQCRRPMKIFPVFCAEYMNDVIYDVNAVYAHVLMFWQIKIIITMIYKVLNGFSLQNARKTVLGEQKTITTIISH